MLIEYPKIDAKADKRQGEAWLVCDEPGCGKEAKLDVKRVERQQGRNTVIGEKANLPKDWASSSEDALEGASDFCPTHADRIYVPDTDAEIPEPIVEG